MPNPAIQFNLPFNLNLGDAAPTSLPPEVRGAIESLYNAVNQLQYVFHSHVGIGQQLQNLWSQLRYFDTLHQASPWRFYAQATETIVYGRMVNLFLSGGALKIRNANATDNTKPCHGFNNTAAGLVLNDYGEVILMQGLLTGVSGLTVGTRYFLSTTDGLLTSAAPVAAGNIEQALGIAVDTTALLFCSDFDFTQH